MELEPKKRKQNRGRPRNSARPLADHGEGSTPNNNAVLPDCKPPDEGLRNPPATPPTSLVYPRHNVTPRASKSLTKLGLQRSRVSRSPSPARVIRHREQQELQNLNERLWTHADQVRQLHGENTRLKLKIETADDIVRRETLNLRTVQAAELRRLQEKLDVANEEKTRLQTERDEANLEKVRLEEGLRQSELQMAALTEKLKHPLKLAEEHSKLKDEMDKSRLEVKDLQDDVKRLNTELHQEKQISRRLDDEAKSCKENYLKEVEAVNTRFNLHVQQADETLEASYENTVAEVRKQYQRDLDGLRDELTFSYEIKLEELKKALEHSEADISRLKRELKTVQQKEEILQCQATRFKAEKAALEVQLSDVQERNGHLKESLEKHVCQAQRERALLSQELVEVKEEMTELGRVNLRLEDEIKSYCEILNGLERKNFASNKMHQRWFTSSKTDLIKGTHSETNKRKLSSMAETLVSTVGEFSPGTSDSNETCDKSKVDFVRANNFSQGVEILDIDIEGKYITLLNCTDLVTDLCLWSIQQTNEIGNEATFQIPCETLLLKDKQLKLWSPNTRPVASEVSQTVPTKKDREQQATRNKGNTNRCQGKVGVESSLQESTEGETSSETFPHAITDEDDHLHIMLDPDHKPWLNHGERFTVHVEDGDGQLQAKCEFTKMDDENSYLNSKRFRFSRFRGNRAPFNGCKDNNDSLGRLGISMAAHNAVTNEVPSKDGCKMM